MIDLTVNKNTIYTRPLHDYILSVYPDSIHGCSYDGAGTIVHVKDGVNQVTQDNIYAMLDLHKSLTVAASKTTILANSIDETVITCQGLPTQFNYIRYLNGVIDSEAGDSGVGGVMDGMIEFSADEAGIYLFEIRDPESYATGYIEVQAHG